MSKMTAKKKSISKWILIPLTVVLTLTVSGVSAYYLGYLRTPQALDGHDHGDVSEPLMGEEKTAQLYTCGMHPWIITEEPGLCPICNMELTPKRDTDSAAASGTGSGEREILYWRAPMDPMEIYDEPGKSKMGMDLVPVYEDELVGGVEIKIDPVTQQNMGVRTAEAGMGVMTRTIRTYGHITYDETRIAQVSPKFSGWIEDLHIDFTGQSVEKGDPLFEIYSPDLLTAQEEYLGTWRRLSPSQRSRGNEFLASARRRLAYYDVAESEIEEMEKTGEVQKTVTIRSPFTGIVTHKNAVEGTFIKAGTNIYTIADLSRVWVEAHIFEYEVPWVEEGQTAEMRLPFHPGVVYTGKVSFVYPYLQEKTRDVVVRLEFENPNLELKPDMFVDVKIETVAKGEGLIVPSEAVIRSGERDLVFVARGNGKFTPREVTLGLHLDDNRVQILSGLAPGESVVTSGQFLIDSESKLKEAVQKMMEAKTAKAAPETEDESTEDDFFDDMEETPEPADDFFKDLEE
mgnify:CR=1 FL=1